MWCFFFLYILACLYVNHIGAWCQQGSEEVFDTLGQVLEIDVTRYVGAWNYLVSFESAANVLNY